MVASVVFIAVILGPEDAALAVFVVSKAGKWVMESGAKALTILRSAKTVKPLLTGFDDVVKHIVKKGSLPDNFINKVNARKLGWNPKLGNLQDVAPGRSIGGDIFRNREGKLPSLEGRTWREADINYSGGYRGTDRVLYSNDGLLFKTTDHYKTFTQINSR